MQTARAHAHGGPASHLIPSLIPAPPAFAEPAAAAVACTAAPSLAHLPRPPTATSPSPSPVPPCPHDGGSAPHLRRLRRHAADVEPPRVLNRLRVHLLHLGVDGRDPRPEVAQLLLQHEYLRVLLPELLPQLLHLRPCIASSRDGGTRARGRRCRWEGGGRRRGRGTMPRGGRWCSRPRLSNSSGAPTPTPPPHHDVRTTPTSPGSRPTRRHALARGPVPSADSRARRRRGSRRPKTYAGAAGSREQGRNPRPYETPLCTQGPGRRREARAGRPADPPVAGAAALIGTPSPSS